MASWKTTLGGWLAAAGALLAQVHDPAWVGMLGGALAAMGVALLGTAARDHNVSDEQSGAGIVTNTMSRLPPK